MNMNKLVAEYVMGWVINGDVYVTEAVSGLEAWKQIPNFRHDLVAAWQIDRPGWKWWFLESQNGLRASLWVQPDGLCVASVFIEWARVPSKTVAYCIARCRAALEAVGIDWKAKTAPTRRKVVK